ncbi:MAG: DMT family transporter, partial [Candidatus Hermodarchaeota archaeon]
MASLYWFGVFLAITSGVVNNFGTVLQKKVVNDVPQEHRDDKFYRTLLTNRLWLFGLILQNGIGAIFFMWAQIYVGPAIIPGLMAAGLIVLALGSLKIVGEELELPEVIGIFLMIGAITMLGLSSMTIDIEDYEVLNLDFLLRVGLFTFGCFAFMIVCEISQRRTTRDSYRGLYLAIVSGFCFALANFWVFPLMAT